MSSRTNSPKHRRFSKKRGKSCDSRDPQCVRRRRRSDQVSACQVGARICNGLGIMRACLETQKLEQLEAHTFTHRYVVEAPAQLSRDEWEKKYSLPAPAETKCDRTPSDESLVLSNE